MASWTTPQDVKDRWLTNKMLPTDGKIQTAINDVEMQIIKAYPAIQERIDDGILDIDYVIANVARIIVEFLQTDGAPLTQESQSYTGAASRSVSYSDKARYSLILTSTDLDFFAPDRTDQAFSLNIMPYARVPKDNSRYSFRGSYIPIPFYGWDE